MPVTLVTTLTTGDRQRERENSELYYPRIKILGSCLFLQSVPVNLHASMPVTLVTTLTTGERERDRDRNRETERERTQNFITQGLRF